MPERTDIPARGFADIHIHLLPGVDDGPADFEESLELLEEAWKGGTRHFCATPHVGPRGDDWTVERAETLCAELSRMAAERGMDPDLRLGAEIALYAEILEDGMAGRLKTLGDGEYVLVESPDSNFPPGFAEFLFRFRATGFKAVLAHPERCDEIIRDPSRIRPFTAAGALVQVTAASLLGESGRKVRKTARRLLENGLVSAVASDGHFGLDRNVNLGEAEREISAILRDQARARHLVVDGPLRIMRPVSRKHP